MRYRTRAKIKITDMIDELNAPYDASGDNPSEHNEFEQAKTPKRAKNTSKKKKTKSKDKDKHGELKTSADQVIPPFNKIEETYKKQLDEIKGLIGCKIFITSGEDVQPYARLDCRAEKLTVAYKIDGENAISYKTLTHILASSGNDIGGLACEADGTCSLYEFCSQTGIAKHISDYHPSSVICDPMFAFEANDSVYIIYNIPTEKMAFSTPNARKPVPSDDNDMMIATGTPIIVKYPIDGSPASMSLPKMKYTANYACSLLEDPIADTPIVVIANVLNHTHEESTDNAPSFKKLFKKLTEPESITLNEKSENFPTGVIAAKIGQDKNYIGIPLEGLPAYRVDHVEIGASIYDDANSVEIIDIEREKEGDPIDI